jgi:hypothetical protein
VSGRPYGIDVSFAGHVRQAQQTALPTHFLLILDRIAGVRHNNVLSAERTPVVDRSAVSAVSWVPGLRSTYRILTAETGVLGRHPTRTGSCGRRMTTLRAIKGSETPGSGYARSSFRHCPTDAAPDS